MEQRVKVERSLGSPADQRGLSVRAKRVPRAGPVPVIDEAGHGRAIVARGDGPAEPLRDAREKFEKAYLEYQLKQANGSVSKIAQTVGMERTHLYRKLKSLGIEIKN